MDFSKIPFQVPTDLETITIQTKHYGKLVLREPIAADFALVESMGKDQNMHERTFNLALRLVLTLDGESGVTAVDLGKLDRKAYKELLSYCSECFLDVMPDFAQGIIQKYISDQ